MNKILLYPITLLYYLAYLVVLCTIHPIQWVAYIIFGDSGLQKSFDYTAYFTMKCTHILGARYTFENRELVPKNVPIIFVANHQSLLDTAGIIWYLRQFKVAFVTKKELGKGIPAISYNLRHSKYVLIDRTNPKQAIPKIKSLAEYIENQKCSAVIFPEGTRSKTGVPNEFAESGLKILCKYAPSAYIVPITINNSWKVYQYGYFPLSVGHHLIFTVHKPIKASDYPFAEILAKTKTSIMEGIKI